MEESQNIDFKGISLHMKKEMSRIRMLRIVFRILTSIVYLCTVVWFGFCIFGGFLVDRTDYETSVTTGKYLMIGFAVFFVLHFAFMKCFAALNKRETYTMAHIIYLLFPGARYNPSGSIQPKVFADSRLFGTALSSGNSVSSTCYGRLDIPVGNDMMTVVDAGVTSANSKDFSAFNFLEVPYQYFIRPIFGVRIESTMHSFRGMFGCCKLNRTFRGYVMLLPDHLENKIGYLAQTVQGMKDKYGAKFLHLEDPEFERHFAVYADDEVEARMVLTPAMMRKLTALRKSFSRDLMLSFNGNMFYYASDTPDGFLRPGRKSLDDEHLLEQLYREVNFCLTVENGIK